MPSDGYVRQNSLKLFRIPGRGRGLMEMDEKYSYIQHQVFWWKLKYSISTHTHNIRMLFQIHICMCMSNPHDVQQQVNVNSIIIWILMGCHTLPDTYTLPRIKANTLNEVYYVQFVTLHFKDSVRHTHPYIAWLHQY